jgi:hypothetical protein
MRPTTFARMGHAVLQPHYVRRLLALTDMKAIFFAAFAYFVLSFAAVALDVAKGFETDSIVLYQPDNNLRERLVDADATDLANYIKQLQAVCTEFFATTTKPEDFHIVVAVRTGKRSKVWFLSSVVAPKALSREPLRKKLEAILPCDVRRGPVAFAISAKLAGGSGTILKAGDKDFSPPIPKEWSDAPLPKNPGPLPDCFLDVVWPDKEIK